MNITGQPVWFSAAISDEENDDDYVHERRRTTSSTTVSPYVQEIYRTKHHRNHPHSHLGYYYGKSALFKKTKTPYHRQRKEKHQAARRTGSSRTNYPQGHISFYTNSNQNTEGGGSVDKWPYFAQVKNHLDAENDKDSLMPPYVKKYNRRNKQLVDLIEGTMAPKHHHKHHYQHNANQHHRKNPHWLEDDLFESQRPVRPNYGVVYEPTTHHPNELPSDSDFVVGAGSKKNQAAASLSAVSSRLNQSLAVATNNHSPPFKISSRAGQFVYHTVTAVPANLLTAAEMNSASGTGVKKKRLPFVAITDRRVGPPKSRRNNNIINNINSNSEQNHLLLP